MAAQLLNARNRLAIGLALGLAYTGAVIFSVAAWSGLGSGFTHDTAAYLEFSPYRQPLYGIWANAVNQMSGTWTSVLYAQVLLFAASVCWVLLELSLISRLGLLAASLLAIAQIILLRMGMIGFVELLGTEGLFYPMIMLSGALLLAWLRTGSSFAILGLVLLMVAMTQLRTAALLVFAVPATAALVAVVRFPTQSLQFRSGAIALAVLTLSLGVAPALLGKSYFQLGSTRDSLGFALLPRVSLLPPSGDTAVRSPTWERMAASWRSAAMTLDMIEIGQFDAQLQEAIRFDLGPKVLLPALLELTQDDAERRWGTGDLYEQARGLSLRWIRESWLDYARLCVAHFWGTLTMGTFMNEVQRDRVWKALNSVDPLTWKMSPLRTDYPLNRIYEPLSPQTSVLYFVFRCSSIAALLVAVFCGIQMLARLARRQVLAKGGLALVLAAGWAVAHSIPIGLSVFPELRYTYANFLALSIGGLAWLAYLDPSLSVQTSHMGRE